MRILFICSNLERVGPNNQLLNIISNLKGEANFDILTLKPETKSSMRCDFELLSVNILTVPQNSLISKIRYIKNFELKGKYDLVQTQGFIPDFISSILFRGRNISTLRNYPYDDYSLLYGEFKGKVIAWFHHTFFRFISIKLSVSKALAEKNSAKSKLNFSYVRNGVDLEKYSNSSDMSHLILDLGLKSDLPTFIFTGPLIGRKNIVQTISSFREFENIQLIVLGDGPLFSQCSEMCRGSKNIRLLGAVDNVADYLSASDFFILLSSSEGLPNSALEALANGMPCVLSNIEAHKELCQIFNSNIALIDITNLRSFLKNSLNDFSLNASPSLVRELAISHLSSKYMAGEYLKQYQRLLGFCKE